MIPLDRVRAMLAAATPGPWVWRSDDTDGCHVVEDPRARYEEEERLAETFRESTADIILMAAAPDLAAQVLTLAAALETAQRERDTARSAHAELAAAVRAEREALSAEWDAASEHHSEMWAETYYATKPPARAATARLTALLAAAPPRSTVDARVVREYLAADAAHWREINNVNGLHDPGRAGRCAATQGTRDAARAALDAALAGCV